MYTCTSLNMLCFSHYVIQIRAGKLKPTKYVRKVCECLIKMFQGLFSSSAIQEVSKIPHSNQRIHYWLKNSQKVANSARKTDFTGIWTFSGTVVFLSKGLPSSLIRASCIQTPPKRISKWWNYMGDYAHGCTWQTSDMQIRFDHERILNVCVYLSHLNSCECSF